jgi:xanthine dehydrogenase YagS FAD-binding subunit
VHPSAAGTALLAYGAALDVVSPKGRRSLPIAEFFSRPTADATRENNLGPGDVIQAVTIPAQPAGTRSVYRKLKEKESFDWPIVETCVRLSVAGGSIRDARVVFGSVAPVPHRAKAAEAVLSGAAPSAALARKAAEAAVSDARPLSQTAYKVRLARVELERALNQLFG